MPTNSNYTFPYIGSTSFIRNIVGFSSVKAVKYKILGNSDCIYYNRSYEVGLLCDVTIQYLFLIKEVLPIYGKV